MSRVIFFLILLILAADEKAMARRRPIRAREFVAPAAAQRLLWVGAHPDDEVLIAPLLGELCIEQGLRCSFLVLTRGEAGQCLLPGGCHPDLATVRTEEMQSAALMFRAELEQWALTDAVLRFSEEWASRIAAFIEANPADLILTFDPRHGSTCHWDHAVTGALVLAALERLESAPEVLLLENRVRIHDGGTDIHFSAAMQSGTLRYEASSRWYYLLWNAEIHASQFGEPQLRALRAVPEPERVLFFLPARLPVWSLVEFCSLEGGSLLPPFPSSDQKAAASRRTPR